jgi:TetR/AcrR family transcriptional repressor of nem operon
MSRPKEFEVSPVLDAVLDSFWSRGYEATSMSDLENATGLSRSSLYSTFGNKRQLFDAALVRYNEQTVEPTLSALEGPNAGIKELKQYFSILAGTFRSEPELAVRGCLIVNTMVELAAQDDAARRVTTAHFERVNGAIENGLKGAGKLAGKELHLEARKITSSVMGALVIAHFNPEMAAQICDQLSAEVSATHK